MMKRMEVLALVTGLLVSACGEDAWSPDRPQAGFRIKGLQVAGEAIELDASPSLDESGLCLSEWEEGGQAYYGSCDDGVLVSFRWDFGDGTPVVEGISSLVSHVFLESGVYEVRLTVLDNEGAKNTFAQYVVIADEAVLPPVPDGGVDIPEADTSDQPDVPLTWDYLEPNDSYETARMIEAGYYGDLTVGGALMDYYCFPVEPGQTIEVYLYFTHDLGDVDLYLIDPTGQTDVAASISTSDNESIRYEALVAGNYCIRVVSYLGNVCSYDMDLQIEDRPCEDDPLEPNDDLSSAAVVEMGDYDQLMACAGDRDYYSLYLNEGTMVWADLALDRVAGDLTFAAMDPEGRVVAQATATERERTMAFTAGEAGFYSLVVEPDPGQDVMYDMSLHLEGLTCSDWDQLEPNDGVEEAVEMGAGAYLGLSLCDMSHDHYLFRVPEGQSLRLEVAFEGEGGVFHGDVRREGSLELVHEGRSEGEGLLLEGLEGNLVVDLWLEGFDTSYEMVVTFEDPVCVDGDAFEPNDDPGLPTMVGEGEYGSLALCPGGVDHYGFELMEGELGVTVSWAGEASMEGVLMDPLGQESLFAGQGVLEVVGGSGAGSYRLALSSEQSISDYAMVVTLGAPGCRDEDDFEPNDTVDTAGVLTLGSAYTGLGLCQGGMDYYIFHVEEGTSAVLVEVATRGNGGMVLMTIYDPLGAPWSMEILGEEASIPYPVFVAGDHILEFTSEDTDLEGYDLSVYIF